MVWHIRIVLVCTLELKSTFILSKLTEDIRDYSDKVSDS